MTIREWLESTFGEGTAEQVVGIESHGDGSFGKVRLMSSKKTGALQCTCGGDCIVSFSRDDNFRGNWYLVRNDSDGTSWDVLRRQGKDFVELREKTGYGYRPHARLELVYTC